MNTTLLTYTADDLAAARAAGDFIASAAQPDGVAFKWWLEGPDGAGFAIFREPHHTDSNIQQARRWLVNTRDVVSMRVYMPETASLRFDLRDCPFCGGGALLRHPQGQPVSSEHQAACRDCGAQTRFFADAQSAARAWNRRVK